MTAPPPKSPAPAAAAPAPAPTPPPAPPLGTEKASTLFWALLMKRPDPLTSVAYTVPLFLFYHLTSLWLDRRTEVDFVSTLMLRVLEASKPAYVLMTLGFTLVLLLVVWVQQKRTKTPIIKFRRVLGESVGFALLALMVLGWATHDVRTTEVGNMSPLGVIDKVLIAAGTGFHEEFLFRGLLITGGTWLLVKLGKVRRRFALLFAMLISSVLFALAHYLVIFDEPFTWTLAGYRVLEGLLFATLYVFRGFAVAVYAHAFYDLLAFFLYA